MKKSKSPAGLVWQKDRSPEASFRDQGPGLRSQGGLTEQGCFHISCASVLCLWCVHVPCEYGMCVVTMHMVYVCIALVQVQACMRGRCAVWAWCVHVICVST